MISLKELEEKKLYLNDLRSFTKQELISVRADFVIANTKSKSYSERAFSNEEKISLLRNNFQLPKGEIPNYFYYEILGILKAYDYIQEILLEEKTSPYRWSMSEDELKWMNRIILDEYLIYASFEKGFYRNGINDKFGDGRLLPDKETFIKRLKELITWYYKSKDDFITKMALFHLIFEENVHPFFDGNGRTGRMIMNLELAKLEYPLIGLKHTNENLYNNAFVEYRKDGSIESMRDLMIQAIENEISKQILIKQK